MGAVIGPPIEQMGHSTEDYERYELKEDPFEGNV